MTSEGRDEGEVRAKLQIILDEEAQKCFRRARPGEPWLANPVFRIEVAIFPMRCIVEKIPDIEKTYNEVRRNQYSLQVKEVG